VGPERPVALSVKSRQVARLADEAVPITARRSTDFKGIHRSFASGYSNLRRSVRSSQLVVRDRFSDGLQRGQDGIVYLGLVGSVTIGVVVAGIIVDESNARPFGILIDFIRHREVVFGPVFKTRSRRKERVTQPRGRVEFQRGPSLLEDLSPPLGAEANRCADEPRGREVAVVLPPSHVLRDGERSTRRLEEH
jgi:hypothetical protein